MTSPKALKRLRLFHHQWTLVIVQLLLSCHCWGAPEKLTKEQVLEELGVKIKTKGKINRYTTFVIRICVCSSSESAQACLCASLGLLLLAFELHEECITTFFSLLVLLVLLG